MSRKVLKSEKFLALKKDKSVEHDFIIRNTLGEGRQQTQHKYFKLKKVCVSSTNLIKVEYFLRENQKDFDVLVGFNSAINRNYEFDFSDLVPEQPCKDKDEISIIIKITNIDYQSIDVYSTIFGEYV